MTFLVITLVACDKNEAPVISGTKDITYIIGALKPNYLENVKALDDHDGDITSSIIVNDSKVDLNKPDTYEVTYIVYDSKGLKTEEKITVTVLKSEALKTEEYIKKADYQTLVNEKTNVHLDFLIPTLLLDQAPMGILIEGLNIGIDASYNLDTYETAEAKINFYLNIETLTLVTPEENVPWFALKGQIELILKNQTLYMKTNFPMYYPESDTEMGSISELMFMISGMIPEEYKGIVDMIAPLLETRSESQTIAFLEKDFNTIKLLAPQVSQLMINNFINTDLIENSFFDITLEDRLHIKKEGSLLDINLLPSLSFLPESLVNALTYLKDINISLDNQNQTFNELLIQTKLAFTETIEAQLTFSITTQNVLIDTEINVEDYTSTEKTTISQFKDQLIEKILGSFIK